MFRFIELIGLCVILWFIANFVHYIVWATSGFEGPEGFLLAMSNGWIKKAKEKREAEEADKPEINTTKKRRV